MFKAINLKKMFMSILIVIIIGGVFLAIASGGMSRVFTEFTTPDSTLPISVMIITFFVLFVLKGVSLYFTQGSGASKDIKLGARNRFWLQMLFFVAWLILFFNLQSFGFSAIWMLLTIVLIGICIKKFASISKGAAYLLVPHLLFCLYLLYLNYGTMMLN